MEWPDKLEKSIDDSETLEDGVAEFVKDFVTEFPESRQLIYDALEEVETAPEAGYDSSDKFSNPEYFGIGPVNDL